LKKKKASFPKEPLKRFVVDKLFRGFSQPPERQNVSTAANNQTTQRYFGNRFSTYQPQIGRKSHAQDICYYCGAVGHGSLNCPEKTEKGVPAQNEVLPFINTNYCLETYEYDKEIHCVVVIHNIKGRLKQNINFWKEKLLLADSSRNLVFLISYFRIWLFFTI
jgi:hypothetical protein